ncbi:LacI family DNA-binding transcriptional regulator [Solirhodobacter olei]|uniref:LacI family DNA-binding transcriptional regulator n=1 Tax=Solirhodobacter olei TaxID=2493082 RepID=UPI0030C7B51A
MRLDPAAETRIIGRVTQHRTLPAMARRPTIEDLARAAGVSTATVDRVLNGRLKVREDTARRVAEAAHRIGFHARGLIERRLSPELPVLDLGFVLLKEKQEFYQNFAAGIRAAVAARSDIRGRALIRFSPSQGPEDFAAHMRALGQEADAIACAAVNHPGVSAAVQELKGAGVPTFALLNDFGQGIRESYIGLNNVQVGRIAAWTIATAARTPGKIAVFVGGNRWHGHELRETGFRSYVREHAPGFTVLDTLVNLETRQVTYEATLDLLHRNPDLKGIYVAGGGMEGAIAAVRETLPPGQIAFVVNELTAESRAALSARYLTLVMATPLADLCRDLVDFMVKAVREGMSPVPGQHFLEPRLYTPESI